MKHNENVFDDYAEVETSTQQDMSDESYDSGEDEAEVVSSTVRAESRRKFASSTPARSQEDYESMIESTYMETHFKKDGTPYEVKVTVLKPEINPLEFIRPVFVYGTM